MSMSEAIGRFVPDGSSLAMGLQMEQMIPFAAGHEIMRQRKRDLRLIGPISDVLFDQIIGAGCVKDVVAAWVGNVMMGSAYNFRRACEQENPTTAGEQEASAGSREPNARAQQPQGGAEPTEKAGEREGSAVSREPHARAQQPEAVAEPSQKREKLKVFNMTNFSISLGLQAGALGVPFLPTRTAQGSDVPKGNHFYYQIMSPFEPKEMLLAVRAIVPDVTIVHVQRADEDGNAHCWGNFGVMIEGVRAAKRVIVVAEEIVAKEIIASDPNRTVIPGFLVSAVVECPLGAHPSPVQGYYRRDDEYFREYHQQSRTAEEFAAWAERWVYSVKDRDQYAEVLGTTRVAELGVKNHANAAPADFGY
jgi:acyl CoA:acetate/3-ketoacid CoA transferase alpha subunit